MIAARLLLQAVSFADTTTDVWSALAHQGPLAVILGGVFFLGYRRIWAFTNQFDRELKLKDEVILEKDKALAELKEVHTNVLSEKDKALAELKTVHANVLLLKDQEIERLDNERAREREERDMYRQYTFRLLEAAREQIPLVTDAIVKNRGL